MFIITVFLKWSLIIQSLLVMFWKLSDKSTEILKDYILESNMCGVFFWVAQSAYWFPVRLFNIVVDWWCACWSLLFPWLKLIPPAHTETFACHQITFSLMPKWHLIGLFNRRRLPSLSTINMLVFTDFTDLSVTTFINESWNGSGSSQIIPKLEVFLQL